jgi:osmotically-inducible protein OsmY
MNKLILFLLLITPLINGCTTIGVGAAELTGVSLFNDRRGTKPILIDEKIENDAFITLNLDSDIRANSHFNVTAFNGIVLLTGETLFQALLPHITETVKALSDVRLVQNHMMIADYTSLASRANDALITAKVKTAFTYDSRLSGLDSSRIKVVTENGRVFLMGLVYPREGDIAADITQQQEGVREVIKVFEYL